MLGIDWNEIVVLNNSMDNVEKTGGVILNWIIGSWKSLCFDQTL